MKSAARDGDSDAATLATSGAVPALASAITSLPLSRARIAVEVMPEL